MATIDLYETRDMLAVLEQTHEPGDFLLTRFVNSSPEFHPTNKIDIDIIRNGKKMAPFVSPLREGVIIESEGFSTRTHTIPYIKMKMRTTAQEFLKRNPGQTMYGGMTAKSHADKKAGKDIKNLDEMIFRREEWMAAQNIQTGQIVIKGEGIDYVIDVGMRPSHLPVLGAGFRWNESTADIQDDFNTLANLCYDDSGLNADIALCGRTAAKEMLRNESFIGALDRRRIDRGEISVKRLPKGVRYYGFDRESGLDIYGYTEQYWDETGQQFVDLIDPKKIVVGSTSARFTRHYGAIQNVETDHMGPRWPDNWVTKDPSVHWISLESAPIVVLHQPDAYACMTVLA